MRKAKITRDTKETKVEIKLNLDGTGHYSINTPIHFLNHMLELFSKHSLIDLDIKAEGDVEIDFHHTVEDVAIVLGQSLRRALSDMAGIRRYGLGKAPMDETLAEVAIDLSGRAAFVYNVRNVKEKIGTFDIELIPEFFKAVAFNAFCAVHINLEYGTNSHHIIESVFKSFAIALRGAVEIDGRRRGIPSTKGIL